MRHHAFDRPCERLILSILARVPDPEIPVISIVDLGIVRGVREEPPAVLITPTYMGCPATQAIARSIREALDAAGLRQVAIETQIAPAWTTDWISDAGREKLRVYGIAPPPRGHPETGLQMPSQVSCPRCGSAETVEVCRFGSTPCKALWRCSSCLDPFDRFKCH